MLTIPYLRSQSRGWRILLPDGPSTLTCPHIIFFPHTLDLPIFPEPEVSLILAKNPELQLWAEHYHGTGPQEWGKLPCSPRALLCNRSSTQDLSRAPACPNQPSIELDQLNTVSVPHTAPSPFSFYHHPSSSTPHFLIYTATRMILLNKIHNKIHILKCFGICEILRFYSSTSSPLPSG